MAEQDSSREDRQLPASERKLRKARADGQVARSRDLGHIMLLACCFGAFAMMAGGLGREAIGIMQVGLRFNGSPHEAPGAAVAQLATLGFEGLKIAMPMALAGLLAGIVSAVVPGGLALTTKPITPDFAKLSPLRGLKRLVSRGHIVDSIKLVFIVALLTAIGGLYLSMNFGRFANLIRMPLAPAIMDSWHLIVVGAGALLLLLALAAAIDVPLQWFRHHAELRMTREEARLEARESEGDPHLKARLRARQREISTARMIAAVPRADVVITNPTHYSVALAYDSDGNGAPRVVAKGADLMALRIREIAREAGVPMFEAPPLARALYAHVDIDREIPGALYNAVAQVLAYVYALRQDGARAGRPATAPAVQDLQVPPELDPAVAAAPGRGSA